jgi:hypothetical protein
VKAIQASGRQAECMNIAVIAWRLAARSVLALLALSISLRPLPAADSPHFAAPFLLAPLLFDHLQPQSPAFQIQPIIEHRQVMAPDHIRRCLPPSRFRRAPLLNVRLSASDLGQTAAVPRCSDIYPPRAPPQV